MRSCTGSAPCMIPLLRRKTCVPYVRCHIKPIVPISRSSHVFYRSDLGPTAGGNQCIKDVNNNNLSSTDTCLLLNN